MGEKVKSYRELIVWQRGIQLVKEDYALAQKLPKEESYALGSQVKRAAVSIPSNVAEGQARQHSRELRQFLYVALGSLAEVDTQLFIARELGYLEEKDTVGCEASITALRKMLGSLAAKLRSDH